MKRLLGVLGKKHGPISREFGNTALSRVSGRYEAEVTMG
jgi:hypothetical protein